MTVARGTRVQGEFPAASDGRLLSFAQRDAERRLGRSLTRGELAIDIVQADRDLAEGKERLAAAIEKEKRRAVHAIVVLGQTTRVHVTAEMILALRWLYGRGREHALAEMEALGVEPVQRRFYARTLNIPTRLHVSVEKLKRGLLGVQIRVETDTIGEGYVNLNDSILAAEIERQIPGALNAASDLVSGGFTAGLADVYEAHADLFSGWQYTAVMDDGTCDVCAGNDGDEYATLEELYSVLPDFGPNPECDGGDRCRCRGVPLGASD